ncbi:MAG: DUF2075 domain-containing protein [Ignavibacteriales bacterium]|nr:DUF2075 domain-containing protein [Ignavibacteriales bacterium]
MQRYYYSSSISDFLQDSTNRILGKLTTNIEYSLEQTQIFAWTIQIEILKIILENLKGSIFFEYSIPRMGRRIDVILIIQNVIFVLEFKIGEKEFSMGSIDQVFDYALDLKNFHETSHKLLIAPILIATEAKKISSIINLTPHNDNLLFPIRTNSALLYKVINDVLQFAKGENIDCEKWSVGRYCPTPTIIEAAMALYNNHSVTEITRSDASAINLSETSSAITKIINNSKQNRKKSICFVTGVPGAGKTLVGLNVATKHLDKEKGITSVFLSGNGPLVNILREALTRDKCDRVKQNGAKIKKGEVLREVKMFIQNVHNFRDECLIQSTIPPFDHVAIFDEAQRAWNLKQTANFMKRKKNQPNFAYSEPEFLISCLDRHKDWAVIICLVGGGQEINTGEAGISEWIDSLNKSFLNWDVYLSSRLTDTEYAAGNAIKLLENRKNVFTNDCLHLAVSIRSFRAENLSSVIKNLLDFKMEETKRNYEQIKDKYPIVLTRNLCIAKKWLKERARGSERYGIIVSSQAQRLKPFAIDVKSPMNPIHWFLNKKDDVRSSYYLEDVATEFDIQGLELDWTCVTWDADFRYSKNGWGTYSFVGNTWNNINQEERKQYLKNAYRVLLTRARQGMVIVVPEGNPEDATRKSEYYDCTFNYLKEVGFSVL